ncbi:MAG: cytochrome oxidase subunit [Acidobacteria bacterium]|nr:cytochrome oxidase subunit [Acidobacteriota bacterium]
MNGGRQTLDVSHLPDHGFGSRSIMWWATVLIICIEATVFVVTIGSYFYLQGSEATWPPADTPLPDMFWSTVNVFILLASLAPNQFVKSAAERMDTKRVQRGMIACDLFALAFVTCRILEYHHLNVSWDSNAYGSITWTLLSFHTFHLVTDLADSLVLTVLMFTRHGQKPTRFVDVAENAFYWYFVVISWLPIYAVLFWAPRLLRNR